MVKQATGFELPQIDLLIQGLGEQPQADALDEFSMYAGPAVTRPGDLWRLGDHRVLCGSALDKNAYAVLLGDEKAAGAFLDPPYNVEVAEISGRGKTVHPEFAMASGEMTVPEFTSFLTTALGHIQNHTPPGAIIYSCMDWRHLVEQQTAGRVSTTAPFSLQTFTNWVAALADPHS